MTDTPEWRRYLEASSLSPVNAREFGDRVRNFVAMDPPPEPFAQAAKEIDLPSIRTKARRLFAKRRSSRDFSSKVLKTSEVATVFSSFASVNNRRPYASAGGMYSVQAFGLLLRTAEPFAPGAFRYDHRTNGLGYLGPVEDIAEAERACSLDDVIHPQMVIIFAADGSESERKYGERAGRFALIEAGHMAQNLALVIAGSKRLKGYELGGIQEQPIKRLLGLQETDAQILHGYACGV